MTDALPEVPDLDSSKVAGASFGRSRKGFEPTEVRTLLGRVSDALRVWEQRDARLAARVEELSRRLDEAEEYDEDRVTEVLGAETARIVAAARSAATEMRSEAERESNELLERSRSESEEAAERLVGEARTDREAAASARTEAEEAAARIVSEATEKASSAVAEATQEAETIRSDALSASEELTESARADADALLAEAQTRHDEMIEQASGVLAERVAAAEEAAAEVRAKADSDASEARATAASELESARKEAERLVSDASAEATSEVDAARERGRQMLAETREVRQRMLRDLAEKNRLGRQKVEGAKAARAGVVDSIRSTLGALEQAMSDLDGDDREIKRLVDAAAAAVPDDVDTVARELEADLERSAAAAAEPEPEVDTGSEADTGLDGEAQVEDDESPAVDSAETVVGLVDLGGSADDETPADGTAGAEVVDIAEVEILDDGESEEAVVDTDRESESEDAPADQMASVHDLFERLRADDGNEEGEDDALDDEISVDLSDEAGEGSDSSAGPIEASRQNAGVPPATAGGGGAAAVAVVAEPQASADGDAEQDEESQDDPVAAASGDQGLLDRRDELLAPAERLIARNLKRLVGDEQNEVLDRARRHKRGRVELDDLLDGGAEATFLASLADPYVLAAAAGAQMWAELTDAAVMEPSRDDVTAHLEVQVAELLEGRRIKVREALEGHDRAGSDPAELVDVMRSAYRELRATTVPELAADLASGAFNSGTAAAAGSDASWRWVPDNGGLPCADAEDNSLEGPLSCGEAFPTGDAMPPAHPGCRCIVVPSDAD